ncbi:MAG: TetR/AcrR family transcriptional regulator [Acidimicrobiales bacterium]|nr:TetR/AcrR family transcriptional regulator [Acidimicrobiales bacterium]
MTPESRSRTRLDPAVRRQQIAEAAARAYAERDPAEVTFEDVADEAGVSRSLVYAYFGDRGNLLAAAYTVELARLDRAIDGALGDIRLDRSRVDDAVRTYLAFASRHRASWNLMAAAGSSRHPAVREAIAARTERIAEQVGNTTEVRLLVSGVIGMLEAAAAQVLENGDTDPDELADLLSQVIWAGVSSLSED